MPKEKTVCQISREQFNKKAQPVALVIGGKNVEAEVKEFSTGSLGWYVSGKVTLEIDGVRVPTQVNVSLIIVGSKDLPPDA